MQIIPLEQIFSKKFHKKTTSSITNERISCIVQLYVNENYSIDFIATKFDTHRRVIRRILKACLSDTEFKQAKSKCYSTSVNKQERKDRQVFSWRRNNPDWVSPCIKDPSVITRANFTKSQNPNFNPSKNFGDTKGSNNGRYINVNNEIIDTINQFLKREISLSAIGKLLNLSGAKIVSLIKENKLLSLNDLNAYSRKQCQTFPEFRFEQFLTESKIAFVYQYPIYFQDNVTGRKRRKIYDFFIPSKNLLIEIDGQAWHDLQFCINNNLGKHQLKKVQNAVQNDIFKTQLALDMGFRIFRINDANIDIKFPEAIHEMILETAFDFADKN